MKVKKKHQAKAAVALAEKPRVAYWPYALGFALTLAAAFEVYGPSLYGPFLFDDRYLPFIVSSFPVDSMLAWLLGVRPILMFSYWVNYQLSGVQTTSYNVLNVIYPATNSVMMFVITRKVLQFANVERVRRELLAAFAGALFLLHPVNS